MKPMRGGGTTGVALISLEETIKKPSKAFRMAEEQGHVVVTMDGQSRYMIIDLEKEPQIEMTEDEKPDFVARRILREHYAAFVELAK